MAPDERAEPSGEGPRGRAPLSILLLRAVFRVVCRLFRGSTRGVSSLDLAVATTRGRLFLPPEIDGAAAPILYVHGGGFLSCSLDTHEAPCRALAVAARAPVLALTYPLAPEAPAPAQLEAVLKACRAVRDGEIDSLGKPSRLWMAGDSAGAYLALRGAIDLNLAGDLVSCVLLFSPLPHLELARWASPPGRLAKALAVWAVRSIRRRLGPRVYPALDAGQTGMPRRVVVVRGGPLDPVSDEAHAFAGELREAGVAVVEHRHGGMAHSAICTPLLYPPAQRVISEAVASAASP